MGRKCCVANCKGNYNKQAKVKIYRLSRNLEERKRWLVIVPTIPNKIFGTKWRTPVKLDRKRKVWYLFLRVF